MLPSLERWAFFQSSGTPLAGLLQLQGAAAQRAGSPARRAEQLPRQAAAQPGGDPGALQPGRLPAGRAVGLGAAAQGSRGRSGHGPGAGRHRGRRQPGRRARPGRAAADRSRAATARPPSAHPRPAHRLYLQPGRQPAGQRRPLRPAPCARPATSAPSTCWPATGCPSPTWPSRPPAWTACTIWTTCSSPQPRPQQRLSPNTRRPISISSRPRPHEHLQHAAEDALVVLKEVTVALGCTVTTHCLTGTRGMTWSTR